MKLSIQNVNNKKHTLTIVNKMISSISQNDVINRIILAREKEIFRKISNNFDNLEFSELVKKFGSTPKSLMKNNKNKNYNQKSITNKSLKKSKKKKKDPNAPKRNMPAFMFFSNDFRNNLKEKNPTLTFSDVGRKLGEMWSSMSDDEKKPYLLKSQEDSKRYFHEKEIYESTKKKKIKRGKSGYILYSLENRETVKKQNSDLTFGQITAKLAEMWKNLSDDEKKIYLEKSKLDRDRYMKEKEKEKNNQD